MNQRVKELRATLGLSGEKFGQPIGLKRSAISLIENGKTSLTEQTLLAICREYNVNEEWLRYGKGEMFLSTDEIPLDELVSTNQIDEIEADIIRAYFSLDKNLRQQVLDHFRNSLSKD